MPEYGTFNLHASLLPQDRGAAPINWAIINGEEETGATTFFIRHEIDTGNIIMQVKEPISEADNVGDLYGRLMNKGAKLVLDTVTKIQSGEELNLLPQEEGDDLKKAPKIFKEDCEIKWEKTSKQIYDFIRGLSPYPAAWTIWNDKQYKIFSCNLTTNIEGQPVGSPWTNGKNKIVVNTSDGALEILELQQEGKKRMNVVDFLRGNTI